MFQIQEYLESIDIPYKTEGKNVTSGWTEINCIFCGAENHLGIGPDGQNYHCWVCGEKGHITNLIRELESFSWSQAQSRFEEYSDDLEPLIIEKPTARKLKLPTLLDTALPIQKKYLKRRRFNIDHLIEEYKIKFFPQVGKRNFCIYAPIIMDGRTVSFVACDTTSKKELKYDNCSIEESIISPKHCLYNIDSVKPKGSVLIVEGITDDWRMGAGCVATLGTEFTVEQIELLLEREIKQAFIMYDFNATNEALRLYTMLNPLIPTEILELDEGDPADLTDEEAWEIKRSLF